MKYVIDQTAYDVVIEKKNNKNIYIRVKEDEKIYVSCHFLTTKHHIMALLKNNEVAIRRMLKRQQALRRREEEFYYFGKKYDIIIVPTLDEILKKEDVIYTPDQKTLEKWCRKECEVIFKERYRVLHGQFQENIICPTLKMRAMKTRWGVCNRKSQTITLNLKLLSYPIECLDYVIIHELCHLVHFDHSKNFWNLVATYCPDYKRIRKVLKE